MHREVTKCLREQLLVRFCHLPMVLQKQHAYHPRIVPGSAGDGSKQAGICGRGPCRIPGNEKGLGLERMHYGV